MTNDTGGLSSSAMKFHTLQNHCQFIGSCSLVYWTDPSNPCEPEAARVGFEHGLRRGGLSVSLLRRAELLLLLQLVDTCPIPCCQYCLLNYTLASHKYVLPIQWIIHCFNTTRNFCSAQHPQQQYVRNLLHVLDMVHVGVSYLVNSIHVTVHMYMQ